MTKNCFLVFHFPGQHRSQKMPGLAFYPKSSSPPSLAGLQALLCLFSAAPGGDPGLCIFPAPRAVRRGCHLCVRAGGSQPCQELAPACGPPGRPARGKHGPVMLQPCSWSVFWVLFPIYSIPLFQQDTLTYIDNERAVTKIGFLG